MEQRRKLWVKMIEDELSWPEPSAASFESLVECHRDSVYRFCARYLRTVDEADDAAQDVFLHAWIGLSRFRGRSHVRTWLMGIAKNVCARYRGRQRRRQAWEAEYSRQVEILAPASANAEPPHTHVACGVLRGLSDADRRVLLLRFGEDLSIEELAERLRTKQSATKMRLYRAATRFRTAYTDAPATEMEGESTVDAA